MAVTRANTTKDYSAMARNNIHKPRERPLTFLLYGKYKKGKTHFCTTAPNVLIVEGMDHGTDDFKNANPDVWTVERWQDMEDVYQFLKYGEHSYQYVALDGMTAFSDMALRFIKSQSSEFKLSAKPEKKRINEYGDAGELMRGFMWNLHTLPIGKIYTAQERAVKATIIEEDEEAETIGTKEDPKFIHVPDLPDKTRSAVAALVDVVGRVYTVRKEHPQDPEKMITSFRLWLAQSFHYDTCSRSEYQRALPDFVINPSVEKLTNLIKTGSKNATG